ncbi:MAG: amidohydrolase [Hyphomicrobiales bacterium]|nr:MAG: amidohydrolase [Hyphomicrobiales bacterium]
MTTLGEQELRQLRHHLHAHPELSRQEVNTGLHMRGWLKRNAPPDRIIDLDGAGFAALYQGGTPGKTVLIRTELDALPIDESALKLPYGSKSPGVSHKCGHDGHMAILAGLAQNLAARRPGRGCAALLFQPDEETGTGALGCVTHKGFAEIAPDYAFALHNFPGYPLHQIVCRAGSFTSSVRFMALKLQGRNAHSAQPETGASPALAIAEITRIASRIQQEHDGGNPQEGDFALIVPIHFAMGVASSGVAPGYGEAHFTLRASRNELVDTMWTAFAGAAHEIAGQHGLELEIEVIEDYRASVNDGEAAAMIETAARDNGLEYAAMTAPRRFGEDFGEITARVKGAMFGLGAGTHSPGLHHEEYDFPDELIPTGIAMFEHLIGQALG